MTENKNSDLKLKEFSLKENEAKISFEGSPVQVLANALADQFKSNGALNYVEMTMHNDEIGEFTVTMQRKLGIAPCEKNKELQAEKEELEAKVEIMTEALERLAKLGNEPLYGTSEGNTIAKIALVRAERV